MGENLNYNNNSVSKLSQIHFPLQENSNVEESDIIKDSEISEYFKVTNN